jgi:hypothetical protein
MSNAVSEGDGWFGELTAEAASVSALEEGEL